MAEKDSMAKQLLDAVREATAGAVTDIRQTWERAWFGRETAMENAAGDMAKQLGWVKGEVGTLNNNLAEIRTQLEKGPPQRFDLREHLAKEWTPEREAKGPEREHGMDR